MGCARLHDAREVTVERRHRNAHHGRVERRELLQMADVPRHEVVLRDHDDRVPKLGENLETPTGVAFPGHKFLYFSLLLVKLALFCSFLFIKKKHPWNTGWFISILC